MSFTRITLEKTHMCIFCYSNINESEEPVAHQDSGDYKGSAHPFHRKCINVWLTASAIMKSDIWESTCPICSFRIIVPHELTPERNRVTEADRANNIALYALTHSPLIKAIRQNNLDRVNALLAHGSIPEYLRGHALWLAAANNHLEIMNALLVNGPILDREREVAISGAANGGHLEIINALFANALSSNSPISELGRESSLEAAIKSDKTNELNKLSVVNVLLNNGSISEEARGWAVINAAQRNYLGVINALLENGPISDRLRERAIKAANDKHYSEIVNVLEGATIPQEETRTSESCTIN